MHQGTPKYAVQKYWLTYEVISLIYLLPHRLPSANSANKKLTQWRRQNNWYKYGHTVRLDCVTVIFLPIFSWTHRKSSRWFHYEISGFFRSQKIFWNFSLRGVKNEPSRWLPIEEQNKRPREPWKQNTHSTGTFLIGGESPSRMKVCHELPAHKGYHGKQGW